MSVYACLYIYICICVYIYIYTYTHAHIYVAINIHIVYLGIPLCMFVGIYIHTYVTCTYMCISISIYIYICILYAYMPVARNTKHGSYRSCRCAIELGCKAGEPAEANRWLARHVGSVKGSVGTHKNRYRHSYRGCRYGYANTLTYRRRIVVCSFWCSFFFPWLGVGGRPFSNFLVLAASSVRSC